MKRIKNYEFKIIVLVISFIILHSAFIIPAFAADSSPSAEIKSKLEQLKSEIASRAAQLKQEISSKLQNKSYIGSIKTISENSITLASATGPKVVNINQDTEYSSEVAKTKYSFKNAKEEDYIAALGDIDDTNVLTAKKIILLPKPAIKKQVVWGQITTLGNNLVVKTKDSKNIKILLDDDTNFQKGSEEVTIDNVKLNDYVIIVADKDQQDVLTATYIYVIPQGVTFKPKKISTPSAQEASKSAKKEATSSAKKQ